MPGPATLNRLVFKELLSPHKPAFTLFILFLLQDYHLASYSQFRFTATWLLLQTSLPFKPISLRNLILALQVNYLHKTSL
ncbi:hypothetical protein BDV3_000237 [Batrachochytrium dendrobatidis]